MKYYKFLILILLAASCAPARFVRPLPKNQHAFGLGAGGPLVGFGGAVIPVPFSSLTYGYGYSDKTTFFGSWHTTALAFGVFQADMGIVHQLNEQKLGIPGVTVTPVFNLALDKWEKRFKFWPEVDVNAFWHYKNNRNFIYAGVGNWFEFAGEKAHRENQKVHWVYYPQIGHTFVRDKWNYSFEVKYIAPNKSNDKRVVDYKGIGGRGALGAYLSIIRKF